MQHHFSTSFPTILQNRFHVFVVRFTIALSCPLPKNFFFLSETIYTNFWSLHFCGTPATLVTQTSRLTYDVMWRKLRTSHYLVFTTCTQKRSVTSKDWLTTYSQEESFSETEKPTRTLNVFLSIKSRTLKIKV